MRRDQRPVQVEPDALPGGIHSPSDGSEAPQAHPMSHRQTRDNAVLASMRLEREQLAHRFANLAPNDAARITAEATLKGYDERIARFEQALQEER